MIEISDQSLQDLLADRQRLNALAKAKGNYSWGEADFRIIDKPLLMRVIKALKVHIEMVDKYEHVVTDEEKGLVSELERKSH